MIKIEELKPEDKGRWVSYEDGQKGRIKRWGVSFIWVVYDCVGIEEWEAKKEEATHWEDLSWAEDYVERPVEKDLWKKVREERLKMKKDLKYAESGSKVRVKGEER